jgi:glycolate oxidase FAD binding subunit
MTVTAEAGMTVAALQAILAREGQTLPVDIPFPDRATLGGAIAVNAAGPRRLGFGTLRDWLIGISFVADNGDEVKAGGRVVKNVAGYDLMKLHLGAFGRFGIVTQVTFKVKPNAESFATVKFDATAAELPALLDRLHESQARPVAVDVMRADDRFTVVCAFEEKAVTVDWQIRTLGDDVKRDVSVDRGDSARATVQRHAEWPCDPVARRIAVKPSDVSKTLSATNAPALAHAMDGIVWIRDGAKADVANRSDAALRETIRRTLDPNGRFS